MPLVTLPSARLLAAFILTFPPLCQSTILMQSLGNFRRSGPTGEFVKRYQLGVKSNQRLKRWAGSLSSRRCSWRPASPPATNGIPLGEVWFPSRQRQFKPTKRVGVVLAMTVVGTGDFRPSSRAQWVRRKAASNVSADQSGRSYVQRAGPAFRRWRERLGPTNVRLPRGLVKFGNRASGPGWLVTGFRLPSRGGGMSDGRYHRFVQ